LTATYPWALLLVAVPSSYVAGRILIGMGTGAWTRSLVRLSPVRWLDLAIIFAASLAVAVMIGHGRARYPELWDSRYATLLLPVGLLTYLLLVRLRAPAILPAMMALTMIVSVTCCWPVAIRLARQLHDPAGEMTRALKHGTAPLCVLSTRYAPAVGYACNPDKLLDALVLLREAEVSVFHPKRFQEAVPGMGRSLVWEAERGKFTGAFRLVIDPRATKNQALEAVSTPAEPATVTYEFGVPAHGSYMLCLRLWTPCLGHRLDVRMDDEPSHPMALPAEPGYYPYCVDFELGAGTHCMQVTCFQAGTRLDLLEIIPRTLGRTE
jgi:hypothetical protein